MITHEHGQPDIISCGRIDDQRLGGGITPCQLQFLERSVCDFSFCERLPRIIARNVILRARKVMGIVRVLAGRIMPGKNTEENPVRTYKPGPIQPLNLKPGDRVRVKSCEEIRKTLDQDGKYQGLSFTVAQKKYCGGTFIVLKRLERVFDERRWKLSRIRETVLLDDAACDGDGGIFREWDGCDRHCLLWWKEAWLERVDK